MLCVSFWEYGIFCRSIRIYLVDHTCMILAIKFIKPQWFVGHLHFRNWILAFSTALPWKTSQFCQLAGRKEQMNVSHALGMKKHRHLFVCLMAVQCGSENHVIIFWLFQKWRDTFCSSLIIFVDKCNKYIYIYIVELHCTVETIIYFIIHHRYP